MGLESNCTLRLGRDEFAGVAHLDSTTLAFRGGREKLSVALGTVKSAVVAKAGELHVKHTGGVFSLLLRDRATAEKWALKIRYPKSLIDKLGLKPESRVANLGVTDTEFLAQAASRLQSPPLAKLPAKPATDTTGLDFIFYPADSATSLPRARSGSSRSKVRQRRSKMST